MGINRKHIAVLCDYELLPNRIGGMDHFFWAFQKACDENNITIDWFFPNTTNILEYKNFNINASKASVQTTFLDVLKNRKAVYSHIITHFLELCSPFYMLVKQLTKAKLIVVDHNPRPLEGYGLKKRFKKRLKGIIYSSYIDVFVGVSKYTSNEILKDFGRHLKPKLVTIYNGVIVDDILARTNFEYKVPKFLVVSHLRESKGIQDLIEAVVLLPEITRALLQVDIYGDGHYKSILTTKMESLGVGDNFKFFGSVDNIKDHYINYDYLLQPTHMECFSLSILESLAANVPVITTPVGGNKEVIEYGINGFILPEKNPKVWAQVLEGLLKKEQRITRKTRPLIEDSFSISKMVHNYMGLIIS